MRSRSRDKHYLRKSSYRKAQIRRRLFSLPDWFVLFDLKIFSGGVYPPSATSRPFFFLFPIVFGINKCHTLYTVTAIYTVLITGTRLVENVPREILLAQAGLDKLADCRKIKCGIFAFKLAFRKNSNMFASSCSSSRWNLAQAGPRSDLRHELSFTVPYGCHPPTSASNQHYEILPFLFLFLCFKLCAPDIKSEASVEEYLLSCQWFNLHAHSVSLIVPVLSCLFLLSYFLH